MFLFLAAISVKHFFSMRLQMSSRLQLLLQGFQAIVRFAQFHCLPIHTSLRAFTNSCDTRNQWRSEKF